MKVPPLATLLSTFFLRYLAVERGVSPHTSTAYRDAIKLLLQFSATLCKRSVDQFASEDLNCSSGAGVPEPSGNHSHQHGPYAKCAVPLFKHFPLSRWPTTLTGRFVQPCS